MKSIFDNETNAGIILRIESLNEDCKATWGKMTVGQMVKHCTLCEELYLGKVKFKRVFAGRFFGRSSMKKLLSDERPLERNAPASPLLIVSEEIENLEEQKQKWISLVKEYQSYHIEQFVHPYFGKMTRQQLGQFIYKHSDHHLRQFNR